MQHQTKLQQLDQIMNHPEEEDMELQDHSQERCLRHCMRAVAIVVDMTKSMNMKDFKPSRVSIVTTMLKYFLKKAKETTPIIKFALAIAEQEACKFKQPPTFNLSELYQHLDALKVAPDAGHFSMEATIRACLEVFEGVPNIFRKQIVIIQSSPLTKDYRDIFEMIQNLRNSGIRVSIISLVGWTHVYQKLIQEVKGRYETVSTGEEFKQIVSELALPPVFDPESVQISQLRVGVCEKESNQKERLCLCHFQPCTTFYICCHCKATICQEPPVECPLCNCIIVLPTDLYNHLILH